MFNLAEFRTRRDYFQWLRREQVLPQLKTQKSALKAQIDDLVVKRDAASKRDREIIENELRPLQWEYQYLWGQVAVIEGEHEALTARVPPQWQAQVFEIAEAA